MEELVKTIRKNYLTAFSEHFERSNNTPFFNTDLVMFGLMDRNIGLVESMPRLLKDENIHALAPLLRVQLDGLLRIHAFRIVESREDLAKHIIQGNALRNYTDKSGKKLTDRYLVNSLKVELPFVEAMYNTLCGWVHFSESHIFAAASEGNDERTINIGIGGRRKRINSEVFQEAQDAIVAIHKATLEIINVYFALPRNSSNKSK